METTFLEGLGLTKGEVKVYLALLEAGTSTSGPIILKSQVARSKVYDIIEKLKEKGLVSELIRENTKYFQALSPLKLQEYLGAKERSLKQQQQALKQYLPELLARQKSTQSEHQIRVYQGYEGIKTLYLEMAAKLKATDIYRGFSFPPEALAHKPVLRLIDNFHRIRAEKGAHAQILCTPGDRINAAKLKVPKNKGYTFRVTKHPFPPSISIFQNTVATFIWGENPRVFTILSPEVADHYTQFFIQLWKEAK